MRGPADAAVTLVEYGDFQCPYCGDAYPVVQHLAERFGDSLRFVFRHMPLDDLHPRAHAAALASEAAAAQGSFWEMHDRLFEHQLELGDDDLPPTPRRSASMPTASPPTWRTRRWPGASQRTSRAAPAAACRAPRASS